MEPHDFDPVGERIEVAAAGFDDFLANVGDQDGQSVSTGILLPELAGVRYRVLCASADLDAGDFVEGYGQWLELAAPFKDDGGNTTYKWKRPVVTPGWRGFPDGEHSWTLTTEPNPGPNYPYGPFDSDTFSFEDSGSSALVYETAGFPGKPIAPGYLGINAYTPPAYRGSQAMTIRDLRYPWQARNFGKLRIPIERPTRVRLYCDVLQTDPSKRTIPTLTATIYTGAGLVPEDSFVQAFKNSAIYHSAGGYLIVRRAPRRPARSRSPILRVLEEIASGLRGRRAA